MVDNLRFAFGCLLALLGVIRMAFWAILSLACYGVAFIVALFCSNQNFWIWAEEVSPIIPNIEYAPSALIVIFLIAGHVSGNRIIPRG